MIMPDRDKSHKVEIKMGEMPQNKDVNSTKKGLKIAERSALPPFLALEVMRKATDLTQAGEIFCIWKLASLLLLRMQ